MTRQTRCWSLLIVTTWFVAALSPAAGVLGDEVTASASEARVSVSINPAVIELRGVHGDSFERRISVTNGTASALRFVIDVQDVVIRDGRRTFEPAGVTSGSIAATAVADPPELILESGESGSAVVELRVPSATTVRAVAIFFRSRMSNGGPYGAAVGLNLASLVTFHLDGHSELSRRDLRIQATATGLIFTQTVSNEGEEPLFAEGFVALIDGRGQVRDRVELVRTRLLPGEIAELRGESLPQILPGSYRAVATVACEDRLLVDEAIIRLGE